MELFYQLYIFCFWGIWYFLNSGGFMNNKGFTLAELLGVILILAVVATLIIINIDKLVIDGKSRAYKTQLNNICEAARNFMAKNVYKITIDPGNKLGITLEELKYSGFVASYIKNPRDGEEFSDSLVIEISSDSKGYHYNVCIDDYVCDDALPMYSHE